MGEEKGIKFPNVCRSSTGRRLIHGPLPPDLAVALGSPRLSPSPPDVQHLLPAPGPLLILYLSQMLPPPLNPPSCLPGLWGRRLPVHHQGDNHPHGELQLPRLRLRGPLSDTCAAGEWSVVAHFLLKTTQLSRFPFVPMKKQFRNLRFSALRFFWQCQAHQNTAAL